MAPRRTIKWQSLTELRQYVIENILSGYPLLHCLDILGCWGFKRLEVNSRSPHRLLVVDDGCNRYNELKIGVYPKEQKFYLTNIQSVVRADIQFTGDNWDSTSEEVMSNAKELLEKTQHVKELSLSPSFLEVVSTSLVKGWQLPQYR